ncbi:hypothetical protein J4218_03855 [Candidatus Pacearchaeota archaeon]|nr:hypothetical protein [Candidatus Pacearchaeota archaeon]
MTLTQTTQTLVMGEKLKIGSMGDRAITPLGTEVILRNDILKFHTLTRSATGTILHISRPYDIISMDLANGFWDGRLKHPNQMNIEEVFNPGTENYKKFDWFLKYHGVN